MPNRSLRECLPLTVPHAPGVPTLVVLEHLRQAARRFLSKTLAWRQNITVVVASDDTNPITVAPADAIATVEKINTLFWNSRDLGTEKAMTDFTPDQIEETGNPTGWVSEARGVIHILPFAAGTVVARCRLTLPEAPPASLTLEQRFMVPDWLVQDHAMCLAYGALSTILVLPVSVIPDSNPAAAVAFGSMFDRAAATAQSHYARGASGSGRLRTKPFHF